MKYLILIIISILYSKTLFADTLKCNFTQYNGAKVKDWIPENQIHEINERDAIYRTKSSIKGTVKQNNDAKIKWSYEHNQKIKTNSRGISYMPSKFNFVFFKTNNKVAADVTFPGGTWIDIGSVWGTCKLEK